MTEAAVAALARIAITGSAGLYGRALIREIRRTLPTARVLGVDRRAAVGDAADDTVLGDICDPETTAAIETFRPDTVVHLAYAVQPGRDAGRLQADNLDGTRCMLAATVSSGARRLLVASSATVYGAWPDNPPRCVETTPLRPLPATTTPPTRESWRRWFRSLPPPTRRSP